MAERAEYDIEVDRSIDLLRESVRFLIEERGGVVLSTDCFNGRIEINTSSKGMKDVDMVMNKLKFALAKVFLEEKIPFKVVAGGTSICIEKASQGEDFEKQIVPRTVDTKGRISIGMLKFLRDGFPIKLYANNAWGKIYLVISARADLPLKGYAQRVTDFETHKRISLAGVISSQLREIKFPVEKGWDVNVVVNGPYAMIADGGSGDSPFASVEDCQRLVLPLLEGK